MSQATLDFPEIAGRDLGVERIGRGVRLHDAAWALLQAVGVGRVVTLASIAAGVSAVLIWNPELPRFPRADREAAKAQAPDTWVPVSRPMPMFALDTPLFPREPRALEARRHLGGGGREEIQSFGRPDTGQPFARLVAYRAGAEAAPPGSLFLDTARRAAEAGFAVTRSAVPVEMATKFGRVETSDVVLSGPGGEHACIAWRLVADVADLRLSGWLCGDRARPADRFTLACALDRLDLVGAGDDRALKAFFSSAERNRLPQCNVRAAPGGRRAGWLDAEAEVPPRLRSHS